MNLVTSGLPKSCTFFKDFWTYAMINSSNNNDNDNNNNNDKALI